MNNTITDKDIEFAKKLNKAVLAFFIETRGDLPRYKLAEALDIHPSNMLRIENGSRILDFETFILLCRFYDVDPAISLQKAMNKIKEDEIEALRKQIKKG